MRFRKLRIASSVVCGIACVLLIALWVRSYGLADVLYLRISETHAVTFGSVQGGVSISPDVRYAEGYFDDAWWKLQTEVVGKRKTDYWTQTPWYTRSFRFGIFGWTVCVPHCFLMVLFGAAAVAPWLRPRFSLRTLLIATTLIAVVLGLVVWAVR
jgi:hypothetical protein